MAHPESARTTFLIRYRQTGNIIESARTVGMNPCTFYRWLAADPAFAARFMEIQSELRAVRRERAAAERAERARVRAERIAAAAPIWAANLAKARAWKRVIYEAIKRGREQGYRERMERINREAFR